MAISGEKHSMKKTMILVTGPPATGKTTLASILSERLGFPVFFRDRITEALWDASPPGDKVPNQFGPASAEVIFHIIGQLMKSGGSFIIESYWHYHLANDRLLALKQRYDYTTVTIRLSAGPDILYDRFSMRQQTPQRHAGLKGGKQRSRDEFAAAIAWTRSDKIDIGGRIIDIDTSDFSNISIERILHEITATK